MAVEFTGSPAVVLAPPQTEDPGTKAFLEEIYRLAEANQNRQAAATIMEYLDALLRGGLFEACGRLLDSIEVSRLSKNPTLLVAFLGITLGGKGQLQRPRGDFFARVKSAFDRELGPDRAERILHRFK